MCANRADEISMQNDPAPQPNSTTRHLSVRLDDAGINKVLDRLDAREECASREALGADERFPYRLKGLMVNLIQPGGTGQSFLVPTRNISRSGFSFLHSGYVHIGTKFTARLITAHDTWQTVSGYVARCAHVEKRFHEIGVCFDRPIDVGVFAPEAVKRRVLMADDETGFQRLITILLGQLNAETVAVGSGQAAVEQVLGDKFDLVLLDLDMPEKDGFETVKELRSKGYCGQVVALTACTGADERERSLAAGFDGFYEKPISKKVLSDLLAGLTQAPLFSSLAGEPGMDELICQFIEALPPRCREIEEATVQKDLEALQRLARGLKGEAGSYGFEPITEAAEKVEESIQSKIDASDLEKQIKGLVQLCNSAQAPIPASVGDGA